MTTRNSNSKVKCMAEKNNKNQIAPLKNNSLSKVSSTLALTNKLLKEIDNRNTLPINDFRVSIPDINFQKYLTDTFEIVITDNSVAYGDIKQIEKINCSYDENNSWHKIKSLEGIQHFTALTNLYCGYNQLTDIDVSQNTVLIKLICYRNQLTNLDVSQNTDLTTLWCESNQITDLDVSQNTGLTILWCRENQITNLDVSQNTALIDLNCQHNQLTDLDVSKNTVLIKLECNDNILSHLDVSQNTALTDLDCSYNQLTNLDVSQNTDLIKLECDDNQLSNLDVSKNTALIKLECGYNKLIHLDVSKNTDLTRLGCYINQLSYLDVSQNTALTDFNCGKNQLMDLDVSKNTALIELRCYDNQLRHLDIFKNIALTKLECYDNQLNHLDVSKNTALISLDCGKNQLTDIDVSQNMALQGLGCSENQLSHLDVSENTALTRLECYDNQLNHLDVSKNTALIQLYCNSTQLTDLDVSKNTALIKLRCSENQLSHLDVSQNTALTRLECYDNQLNHLDVSKNTALIKLRCSKNQLSHLDVSKNTTLSALFCYNNQLTGLDVSQNMKLTFLGCSINQLTDLDVSQNMALTSLGCGENQIAHLDLSKHTKLTSLYCGGNQLTNLDVSQNTLLTNLSCEHNQLTELDVSQNTALTDLNCGENQLTELDVSKNTALTSLIYENNMGNFLSHKNIAKQMNYSIKEMYENGLISVRAFNVCISAELKDLFSIINFYDQKRSFKNIRNCGSSTELELIKIVLQFSKKVNNDPQNHANVQIPILELNITKTEKLFCRLQDIKDTNELLEHYLYEKTFDTQTNDKDKKIKKRLILICQAIINDDFSNVHKSSFKNYFNKSNYKKDLLLNSVNKQYELLSVRSRNVLEKQKLSPQINLEELIWSSFLKIRIDTWRNIGAKSIVELTLFFENCRPIFHEIYLINLDENDLMIKTIESKYKNLIFQQSDKVLIKNKKLDFFEFIFNNYEKFLSDFECSVFTNTPKSILSNKLKISIERVRQKIVLAEDQIIKVIDKIYKELFEYINYNDFNFEETFILLSETKFYSYSSKINSKIFNELILFSVKNNDLKLKLIQLKSFLSNHVQIFTRDDRLKLYKFLLIDNYIIVNQYFNFTSISKTIFEIAKDLIIDNHDIYILDISNNISSNAIYSILKTSINDQFGIIKYEKSIYIFKQTNKMYCYIALKIFEKNTDLDKIYSFIIHNVGFNKKPEKTSIRGTLITDKNLFFSIGKTSTYGLSEWNKTDLYATNSIKDECILLLNNSDIPLHSNQMFSILQIRRPDVPLRSIQVILEMEKDIFDNSQGFYWLKNSINSFELPVNHKTAYSQLNQVIKKIDLNNFWCETKLLINYLLKYEMPKYQIDYIIDHYLISFQGKSTLKLELDFLSLLKEIDDKDDVKDFLIDKYMQLDVQKRSDFRNKFQTVLQKKSDQLITRQIVNKIIQFYI